MHLFVSRCQLSNYRFKQALLDANFMQAVSMRRSLMMYTEVCAASCKCIGHEQQVSQLQRTDCLVWSDMAICSWHVDSEDCASSAFMSTK